MYCGFALCLKDYLDNGGNVGCLVDASDIYSVRNDYINNHYINGVFIYSIIIQFKIGLYNGSVTNEPHPINKHNTLNRSR